MELICSDPRILQLIYVVQQIFEIIYIIVPIVLIITATIDIFKVVIGDSSKINEAFFKVSKRLMAVVCMVLFIPLYNVVLNMVEHDPSGYSTCLANANPDTIAKLNDEANIIEVMLAVNAAESSLNQESYDVAKALVSRVTDATMKYDFELRLNDVNDQIIAIEIARLKYENEFERSSEGGQLVADMALAEYEKVAPNYGGEKYIKWYYGSYGGYDHWCAMFTVWVANEAGFLGEIVPKLATVGGIINYYNEINPDFVKDAGTYTPKPGDLITFGEHNHIGIVIEVNGSTVTTVEGNGGNYPGEVVKSTYSLDSNLIYKYCLPPYED